MRLLGVDDPWLRQKLGISVLINTGAAAKLLSWEQHNCYHFVLFFWCTILVPSLKNTSLIFLEIFLIQFSTVLVDQFMTSSLSSFAKYKNVNISETKEDNYSKLVWQSQIVQSVIYGSGTVVTQVLTPAVLSLASQLGLFPFTKYEWTKTG